MSEHLHEILRPVRDIVRGLGEFVVGKILPQGVFDDFGQNGHGAGFDNSPLDEPVFNPDGE